MTKKYLFTSERLGFRNWEEGDKPKMAAISGDPEVMTYFPSTQDLAHVSGFITRMQKLFAEKGFCYFAVETLSDQELIGFIGICEQNFEASFTPCIDIGWRLSKKSWNKGYATEGAKRCLEYAFNDLKIETIVAICSVINVPSERVMQKIGMQKKLEFDHSLLKEYKDLERCVLYKIEL